MLERIIIINGELMPLIGTLFELVASVHLEFEWSLGDAELGIIFYVSRWQ
jgi:hypothetical protein